MEYVIITCDPDNWPSRKTCEWLGGELLEITELPEDNDMRVEDSTVFSNSSCISSFFRKPVSRNIFASLAVKVKTGNGAQIGGCNLRLGHSEALYYAGNIGYQIDEPYRGHHYGRYPMFPP